MSDRNLSSWVRFTQLRTNRRKRGACIAQHHESNSKRQAHGKTASVFLSPPSLSPPSLSLSVCLSLSLSPPSLSLSLSLYRDRRGKGKPPPPRADAHPRVLAGFRNSAWGFVPGRLSCTAATQENPRPCENQTAVAGFYQDNSAQQSGWVLLLPPGYVRLTVAPHVLDGERLPSLSLSLPSSLLLPPPPPASSPPLPSPPPPLSSLLLPAPPSLPLLPPPSSLLPPSSSLPSAPPPPPKALKDGHCTTARAIRSPHRVRRRAQGFARHHSESAPTRPIPAAGSPASSGIRTAPQRERSDTPDPQRVRRRAQGFARHHSESAPTRPIPAEGSSASSRIRTAPHRSPQRVRRRAIRHARSPQRVRRRAQGFARHQSESAPTRPIPAEGSSASSRIRTAPQRERSDTPDPRRGFPCELKDSHGSHSESAPTRPIPAEGSSASSRIRTAPQRSPQKVRRRAIRQARSPQRVRRRAQGFARHHSESAPTRPIPAEGSSASSRIRTAPHRSPQKVRRRAIRHARSPQRVRRRAQGFARHHSESAPTRPIPAEGSSASSRIRTAPQRERSDTPDPCRGFIGELKDSHGTTARALRLARHHSESAPTRPIPVEGSSASSRMGTAPQREHSDTPDPCRGFIGELKDSHGTTARALRHARSL